MTLMNRSPYVSLLSKALAFVPCCRPADAALFLATHSYSAASGAPESSLMAEYLVSSCGFDPDQAAKASKLLGRVESRHQPDSVLGFFKSYGFDNTQVKKVISANPRWLLLDVEKTLAPKFRALQDLGFSCSDITHLVRSNNHVISHKSQTILSKIQLWQGLLGSNDLLMKICKRNRWFLGYSIEKTIQPNIEILRDCGITDQKLSMILRQYPVLITQNAETLKALISRVEGLGVPRTSGMFLLILSVLQSISEKNFKAHLEFFKGFGWSEDDFLAAFRKAPTFVRISLKSLQRKMEFLVNEAGCAPSHLALRPDILLCSLEKRLMPRHQIVTGLKSRGVCISNLSMSTYAKYPEKKFVEKFVNRYKEYPELIELYNGVPKNRTAFDRGNAYA
ncbi:transcription termination factor MTERF4, chloroplastic-like [Musa acuminata AAA Group]|uniref:transcription termination factor MTERF4, chloroplastic-like n=1 Tax=Musa acuminata AAA Group TaxID=214697 RepID=UPI0031E366D4